jgi:hypothetical protein
MSKVGIPPIHKFHVGAILRSFVWIVARPIANKKAEYLTRGSVNEEKSSEEKLRSHGAFVSRQYSAGVFSFRFVARFGQTVI